MPSSTTEQLVENARRKFEGDTAAHQLTILRDDGLYRHLRAMRPKSYVYGFDIVTWPGYLAIVGDAGDYVFSRVRDMFEFFRGERINPVYWAEKLRGPGEDMARRYSPERYRESALDWFAYVSEGMPDAEAVSLKGAVDSELLDEPLGDVTHSESEAYRLLAGFSHNGHFIDTYDFDLREFDQRFLWCCWAIVWAINRLEATTSVGGSDA